MEASQNNPEKVCYGLPAHSSGSLVTSDHESMAKFFVAAFSAVSNCDAASAAFRARRSVAEDLDLETTYTWTMIKHSIDVTRNAVEHFNPGHSPVLTCDQPLFCIGKANLVEVVTKLR